MKKQEVIKVFKSGHKEFMKVVNKLSREQIESVPVVGKWTTKEVMAHLAAWNWEQAKEIKRVLKCKPTWNNTEYDAHDDNKFNEIQVKKRKDKRVTELMEELGASFVCLMKTIDDLSEVEWNHKCEGQFWEDGKEMSIQSLFPYESKGSSDTGRHTKDIRKRFNL